MAQPEETSEVPSEAPLIQTNVVVVMAAGVGVGSERAESKRDYMLDSYAETPQDHTMSEK